MTLVDVLSVYCWVEQAMSVQIASIRLDFTRLLNTEIQSLISKFNWTRN